MLVRKNRRSSMMQLSEEERKARQRTQEKMLQDFQGLIDVKKLAEMRESGIISPTKVEESGRTEEYDHEEALERYRKLLKGLNAIFSETATVGTMRAVEARKEIVGAYGLTPPGPAAKIQEVAEKELEMAMSCIEGRGMDATIWTAMNQDIINDEECDLRHLLIIEMGLVKPEVKSKTKPSESPPWFRGNWKNMVEVIRSVHSMQIEGQRLNSDLRGSKVVQVIPVRWNTDEDGTLEATPAGKFRVFTCGRIDDKRLRDAVQISGSSNDDYWMPEKVRFLAKTEEFFEKAKKSAGKRDEGWIAIPFGASLLPNREERWGGSWRNGVPASLWTSLPGPPEPFGRNRGDLTNEN